MNRLSHTDLENALAFTARLHSCREADELRRLTVRGISELIGADSVTFEHFAPNVPRLWAVSEPDEPYQPWMWEIFLAHLHEHPAIMHYRATGDPAPLKISDFLSVRDWHRTGLYQQLYRLIGYEDQMGISLGPRHREFYSVVLSRGRRSFTQRDRCLFELLRPHIAQAHANARTFDRLRRLAQERNEVVNWLPQTAIVLDENGCVRHCPARARQWLHDYFGQSFQRNELPTELAAWLRRQIPRHSGNAHLSTQPVFPLVSTRNGSRLIVRLQMGRQPDRFAIVMEQQSAPNEATIRRLGLTRRQAEILIEVEKGKTNDEIATALFISPLTVRTHLDKIFNALGVTNRTAAVARLRGIA